MHPPVFLQQPIRLPPSLVSGHLLTRNPGHPDPAHRILFQSIPNSYQIALVRTSVHLPHLKHRVRRIQWISLLQFPLDPDPGHYLKNRIRISEYPLNQSLHLVPLPVFQYHSTEAVLPYEGNPLVAGVCVVYGWDTELPYVNPG